MNSFTNTDGLDNLPGIKSLQFIPVQHVTDIPEDINSVVYDEITVKPGKGWFTGEFTPGKLKFGDDSNIVNHGPFHEINVSGFHAFTSAAKLNNFKLMQMHKFIVLVEDYSDNTRIIGTLESPCDFTFKESSGSYGNQQVRGYEIEFKTANEMPAFYYESESDPPVGTGFTVFYPDGETVYSFFENPSGGTFTIPYSSNMIFKHYLSDDPAIAGGAANKRIFADFIDYDIDHLMIVIQGIGLVGQLTTLSPAKQILTNWVEGTGEATFKGDGPADDVQITVLGFIEL